MLPLPALLMEIGSHQIEVAETLIGVGRFLVIFVAARAIAELMVRLQLPTILGELVAGVLIGASGLHLVLPPDAQAELSQAVLGLVGSLADVPADTVAEIYRETFPSLQAVSQIGLFALLFLTGLESELDELVAVGLQATSVAVTGVVVPFALGTAGLHYLFHVPLIPALFAGAAMTATSIGITASVFGELQWLKRKEGQIVIGAAVLDDILGIVILAVVVSLAGGGAFSIGPVLKLCAAAVVFVAAGLILSASKHTHDIDTAVKPLVALFATVFFVLIGTGMDLSVLNPFDPANREGLIVAVFLLVVAVAGKVAAGWTYPSKEPTNRLVVGLGMMPRGEVGLIFLGLGTQAGILTPALEAAILLMVIGTTFLAPVLLRVVIGSRSAVAAQPS